MQLKKFLSIVLICTVHASCSQTDANQSSYVDELYTDFSGKILEWSELIDTKLCDWLEDPYDDTPDSAAPNDALSNEIKKMDSFFQNQKFFDESEKTYLRLRLESDFHSKEPNDFNAKLNAQLPLSRSKKHLKIFIDDLTDKNAKDLFHENLDKKEPSSGIGIHYFAPQAYGITSRYSLGMTGITPFVRAKYNIPFKIDGWMIDPIQLFQYSTENELIEQTNIYFDKKLENSAFFRLLLHRKTESEINGMDYALALQYFQSPKKDKGFSVSQSFEGNTEYLDISQNNPDPKQANTYSGINNYTTSFRWRESIWRKWFFYEMGPAVNFHKKFDYKPNYSLNFMIDFYFGNYR